MELNNKLQDSKNHLKQIGYLQIGKAKFDYTITNHQLSPIFEERVVQMLETNEWEMKNEKFWQNSKFQHLFYLMKSTSNQQMRIYWWILNQSRFLLVTRIQFQNLLVLGLSWNKIENIESLVYLDAPMLRLINLDSNSIRTVSKSLNKLLLKSLRSISLESNPIYQVSIGRFKTSFCVKKATNLHLEYISTGGINDAGFVINSICVNFAAKMDLRHGDEFVAKVSSTSAKYDQRELGQINQRKALAVLKRKKMQISD